MSAPPDAFAPGVSARAGNDGGFDRLPSMLRRVAAHALAQLHTRLELLQVEFALEQLRLRGFALFGALTLVFAFIGLALLVLLVIAAAWDTPWRLHVIGGLAGTAFLVAIVCGYGCLQRRRGLLRPFDTSLAELVKDRRALEEGL